MRQYESPEMQPPNQYVPDYFLSGDTQLAQGENDTALLGYFDKPIPTNDNRSVVRSMPHSRDYCSSRLRRAYVRMPRVSMIDGPVVAASANDNRRAA